MRFTGIAMMITVALTTTAFAAEWFVAPNGAPNGQGTKDSPWDIASALAGKQKVAPGDTLWLRDGTYKKPFELLGQGFKVQLAGREGAPIHVRYTMHAYGSSRADVDNYLAEGNVCYNAGTFLIGGGKPSHNIRVFNNVLYGVNLQLGYNAPFNEDCEVRDNVVVNGGFSINKFHKVVNESNLIIAKNAPCPGGARIILRPNKYDPHRANLAIFNWDGKSSVDVDAGAFLKHGDRFRLMNPRDFFGKPVVEGVYDGKKIAVPMAGEFAAFVILK